MKKVSTLRKAPRYLYRKKSWLRSLVADKKLWAGVIALSSLYFMWAGVREGVQLADPSDRVVEFSSVAPEAEIPAREPAATPSSVSKEAILPQQQIQLTKISDRIRAKETLLGALNRYSVSKEDANELIAALKKHLNLHSIKAGDAFVIEQNQPPSDKGGKMDAFEFIQTQNGLPVRYRATREANPLSKKALFVLAKYETPVVTQVAGLSGRIETSLYSALVKAGGDASLVNRFAEVFGSQLDFSRDPQLGDTFKLILEKRTTETGRFVGYGKILAAEFNNSGERHRGIYYESADGKYKGLFNERGESLIKSFVKNPMELVRISSGFNLHRHHPVLGYSRKHLGTDFAAPIGTPVWSVADGTIMKVGRDGGRGRFVQIRHENGYMTEYFHFSRFAANLKVGNRVKLGQVIGYVGMTGLASGPHLHLGMKKNGVYVDFAKQKFPGGPSIPKSQLAAYSKTIRPLLANLDKLDGTKPVVRLTMNP